MNEIKIIYTYKMHGTYIEIIHKHSLGFSGCKMIKTKETKPPNETTTGLEENGARVKKNCPANC